MQKHNEHGDNMNIPPQTMLILICDIKQLDILYQKKKIGNSFKLLQNQNSKTLKLEFLKFCSVNYMNLGIKLSAVSVLPCDDHTKVLHRLVNLRRHI